MRDKTVKIRFVQFCQDKQNKEIKQMYQQIRIISSDKHDMTLMLSSLRYNLDSVMPIYTWASGSAVSRLLTKIQK